ncbi:hypothetical protein FOE78_15545 [Microlunatus elymi]|uniref:Uncharacterized protein n=1 Tax=Microlunatus elymi TaxID=2596828 RepID=A0A516Q1R0_9ACTN|nr:hypothetical protein [Microlunatus elymi]QDP97151.1 hypothetical protein FOE78_15545 [Microlunatus elymi]
MIFLCIAIAWIVLLALFVIVWARFAARRRALADALERDRLRSRPPHLVENDTDGRRNSGGAA